MDLVIPLHTFDPNKVILDSKNVDAKSIVSFSYKDGTLGLQNMTLMLPITHVISYQPTTGKLILDMKENYPLLQKLRTFQDILISFVENNQGTFFKQSLSYDQIESQFQKLVNQSVIILYCPSSEITNIGIKPIIPIYKNSAWNPTLLSTDIMSGSNIRIIFKLVGISFQLDASKAWTGKFRIQHKIVSVFRP